VYEKTVSASDRGIGSALRNGNSHPDGWPGERIRSTQAEVPPPSKAGWDAAPGPWAVGAVQHVHGHGANGFGFTPPQRRPWPLEPRSARVPVEAQIRDSWTSTMFAATMLRRLPVRGPRE